MKRKIKTILLCWLFCFAMLCVSGAALGFTPQWKPGDTWMVEVSYAQVFGPEKWSEPILWLYSISEAEKSEQPGIILEARNKTDNSVGLRVWLTGDLTPVKVQTFRKIRGKEKIRLTEPEPDFPLRVGYTPAPFDFPRFPLEVPSTETFTRIRALSLAGDLRTSETLHQKSRWINAVPESYGIEPRTGSRDIIEVKVLSGEKDTLFCQYWDNNMPWPLYGENKNMKYRLVQE